MASEKQRAARRNVKKAQTGANARKPCNPPAQLGSITMQLSGFTENARDLGLDPKRTF